MGTSDQPAVQSHTITPPSLPLLKIYNKLISTPPPPTHTHTAANSPPPPLFCCCLLFQNRSMVCIWYTWHGKLKGLRGCILKLQRRKKVLPARIPSFLFRFCRKSILIFYRVEGIYNFISALPDASVHAVISAQGFHWFANQRSVSEIHRVLIPGGAFGLIWNHRDVSLSWVRSVQDVIDPFYKQFKTPLHWDNKWRTEIEKSGKFAAVEGNTSFRLNMEGGLEDMLNVVMCLSCIVRSSKETQEDIRRTVTDILMNHPDLKGKGTYVLPYVTDIFWCRSRSK